MKTLRKKLKRGPQNKWNGSRKMKSKFILGLFEMYPLLKLKLKTLDSIQLSLIDHNFTVILQIHFQINKNIFADNENNRSFLLSSFHHLYANPESLLITRERRDSEKRKGQKYKNKTSFDVKSRNVLF